MHNRIKIFCEGITDQVFIADCLNLFWNIEVNRIPNAKDKNKLLLTFGEKCEIINVDGCSKLDDDLYINMLKDNIESGGKNVVIFDADYEFDTKININKNGNNGFISAKQKLLNLQKHHNINFDFYLWHNNREDGDLEELLIRLIPEKKTTIINCIDSHQECLKKLNDTKLRIADKKTKLNYYLHIHYENEKPKDRDYKNTELWCLDTSTNSDLLLFIQFLEKCLFQ